MERNELQPRIKEILKKNKGTNSIDRTTEEILDLIFPETDHNTRWGNTDELALSIK
jgi:hypothetical protein